MNQKCDYNFSLKCCRVIALAVLPLLPGMVLYVHTNYKIVLINPTDSYYKLKLYLSALICITIKETLTANVVESTLLRMYV